MTANQFVVLLFICRIFCQYCHSISTCFFWCIVLNRGSTWYRYWIIYAVMLDFSNNIEHFDGRENVSSPWTFHKYQNHGMFSLHCSNELYSNWGLFSELYFCQVVRWGRSVYANIQKFLQFQLTVNVTALCINFVAAISSGDVPLTAVQVGPRLSILYWESMRLSLSFIGCGVDSCLLGTTCEVNHFCHNRCEHCSCGLVCTNISSLFLYLIGLTKLWLAVVAGITAFVG